MKESAKETPLQVSKRSSSSYSYANNDDDLINYDFDAFGSKFALRLAKNEFLVTPRQVHVTHV